MTAKPLDRPVFRFTFAAGTDMDKAQDHIAMAIMVVGFIQGDTATRLEAGYAVDVEKRKMVVQGATPLARSVAKVFLGFMTMEIGAENFLVESGPMPQPETENRSKVALFKFPKDRPIEMVRGILLHAITAAEGLFGAPVVRIAAAARTDTPTNTVRINLDSECGRAIAKMFAALAAWHCEPSSFQVSTVEA